MKELVWLLLAALGVHATTLDEGYRQMYNLQFADAHRTFAQYQRQNPADPLGPVSDAAAFLFSEFDRLNILQSEFFTNDRNFLDFHKPDGDPQALFASILRLGLHSDYLALIEKRNMAALAEIKQARILADRLLASHPQYYDAYIAEGLENYLLSLKPAPIRWLLHAGGAETNKQTGIEKLRLTAEKGRYLLPYARLLLAVADLRDNAPQRAK